MGVKVVEGMMRDIETEKAERVGKVQRCLSYLLFLSEVNQVQRSSVHHLGFIVERYFYGICRGGGWF